MECLNFDSSSRLLNSWFGMRLTERRPPPKLCEKFDYLPFVPLGSAGVASAAHCAQLQQGGCEGLYWHPPRKEKINYQYCFPTTQFQTLINIKDCRVIQQKFRVALCGNHFQSLYKCNKAAESTPTHTQNSQSSL